MRDCGTSASRREALTALFVGDEMTPAIELEGTMQYLVDMRFADSGRSCGSGVAP